jgi:hypothetical protein
MLKGRCSILTMGIDIFIHTNLQLMDPMDCISMLNGFQFVKGNVEYLDTNAEVLDNISL